MASKKRCEGDIGDRIDWLKGIYSDWQATRIPPGFDETDEYLYEDSIDPDLADAIFM